MSEESKVTPISSMKFNIESMLGFVGFVCTVASLLNLFTGDLTASGQIEYATVYRLSTVLGMIVSFALISAGAYRISTDLRKAVVYASFGGSLVLCLVVFFVDSLPFVAAFACYVFLGMCLSALLSLWFLYICVQPSKALPLLVTLGFACGLSLFFLAGAVQQQVAKTVQVLVWTVSPLCFIALERIGFKKEGKAVVKNADSDRRSKITRESAIMFSTTSFHFGYLSSVSTSFGLVEWCLLSALVVSVLLIADYFGKRMVSERSVSQIAPPLTMLAYAGMFLFGPVVRVSCLCLLTALFLLYSAIGWAAMVEHVRLASLSPLRVYAKARKWDYLALAAGLLIGFMASAFVGCQEDFVASQIGVLVAVVYAFVAAFNHKPRFPQTSITPDSPSESVGSEGLWKKRCRALSEKYGLSERQHEVLILMAQGRSAKHIQQVLTISLSTAQTHIRNIYRKIGVHNREELLSAIENTKLYGED